MSPYTHNGEHVRREGRATEVRLRRSRREIEERSSDFRTIDSAATDSSPGAKRDAAGASVSRMHPIERLRYVARAGLAPDRVLVAEAVPALSAFAGEPGAQLVALRRLINRQPESPGLVVLGARVLCALDPIEAAWQLVDELETDPTSAEADRLAESELGTVDVIDTAASGPGSLLCPAGTLAWTGEAHRNGVRLVAATPLGTRLPQRLWNGYLVRNTGGLELLDLDVFDELIDSDGRQPIDTWSPDCPDVAELSSF